MILINKKDETKSKKEQSESSAVVKNDNPDYKSEEGKENIDQEIKESLKEEFDPEIKFPLMPTRLLFNFNTVQLFFEDLCKL